MLRHKTRSTYYLFWSGSKTSRSEYQTETMMTQGDGMEKESRNTGWVKLQQHSSMIRIENPTSHERSTNETKQECLSVLPSAHDNNNALKCYR